MTLAQDFISTQKAKDEFEACRRAVSKHFDLGIQDCATDLHQIAARAGIEIRNNSRLQFEGMIERESCGRAVISLKPGMNARRERFTLAHELGHYILQCEMLGTVEGKLFRGVSRDSLEIREEERLANLLAAELLLPFSVVHSYYDQDRMMESLLHICRRFRVSRMMAVRRIADVFSINIALLQIVPYMLKQPETHAQVDDALFAEGGCRTFFNRRETWLKDKVSYAEIVTKQVASLSVLAPGRVVTADFEINPRSTPLLHAFAIGVF